MTPGWLVPLTALIVALIGVLQEQIRRFFFGPKLDLWYDPESLVDSHRTTYVLVSLVMDLRLRTELETFWVRLRVANTGKMPAHSVELIAKELWRRSVGATEFTRDPKFSPLGLKWAFVGKPVLDTLPAQIEKHCDLLHIPDPARTSERGVRAYLELEVQPNASPGVLVPGDYKLVLVAVASDAGPRTRTVSFTVPPEWTTDEREMQRRVRLTGVPSQSPIMAEPEMPG